MLPGQIGWSAPKGEDAIIRRILDLERAVLELGPSIAKSFNTTVAGLTTAQTTLATTVSGLTTAQATLASFVTVANASSLADTINTPASTGTTIVAPFTAGTDPTLTVNISTGKALVSVTAFGQITVTGGAAAAAGYGFGYVIPEVVSVDTLSNPTGLFCGSAVVGTNQYLSGLGGTFTTLYNVTPGTYTVRARRAVQIGGSSSSMQFYTTYRTVSVQVIP